MAVIVVVGAGMGGLAVAVRLAAAGHDVTVCEQAPDVGGKLGWYSRDGFSFDTGPSLLTMPHVFDELFAAASVGADLRAAVDMRRLDPLARYLFADGTTVDAHADDDAFAAELDARLGRGAGAQWRRLDAHAARLWAAVEQPFLRSAVSAAALARLALRRPADLVAVAPGRTLRGLGRRYLNDPRLRMFSDRYATYAGSDPRRAPAALAVVGHVERRYGGWYVQGGLRRLAAAVAGLARERGVRIRCHTRVEEITRTGGGRVSGVRLAGGGHLPADVVVANADAAQVYGSLVDHPPSRALLRRLPASMSGFVLLLALAGRNAPGIGSVDRGAGSGRADRGAAEGITHGVRVPTGDTLPGGGCCGAGVGGCGAGVGEAAGCEADGGEASARSPGGAQRRAGDGARPRDAASPAPGALRQRDGGSSPGAPDTQATPDTPGSGMAHHTVIFPADYDAEFDAVFGGRLAADPTVYISAPPDPALAPPGCEAWFVLVNAAPHTPAPHTPAPHTPAPHTPAPHTPAPHTPAPHTTAPHRAGRGRDRGLDWDRPGLADAYARHILDRLAARGLDVRDRLLWYRALTPADLERGTGTVGGSIYGPSSNGARAAFLRPANTSPVPGLFLVGGSTHPGGGLPLVALSARIVADLIGPA